MTLNANGTPAMSQSAGVVNFANGNYTGDGSGSIEVFLGFTPRFVKIYDVTDATTWEWCEGMPATDTIKTVTAGTMTVDTNTVVAANGKQTTVTEVEYGGNGAGDGNNGTQSLTVTYPDLSAAQLTIGSGANVDTKVYAWVAFG